jgi:ribulose 1,5-bisphosphate synthetase/thiazole synthase
MEINKYIKTEMAKLDRGIVATPENREQLENFAGGCGQGSLILMQMAMQYGYKVALENLQIKYESKSII